MTASDIAGIESALGLRLPEAYVALVCSEEMESKYGDTELGHGLLFDRNRIDRENRRYRELPVASDYWDSTWLAIHTDGMSNAYFITTDPYDGRIYDFDHEQTFPGYDPTESPAFPGMKEFLAHLDAEKSWEEDARSESEKRSSPLQRFLGWLAGKPRGG